MPKQIIFSDLASFNAVLKFNASSPTGTYHRCKIVFNGTVRNEEVVFPVTATEFLGAGNSTPYTSKQIYTWLDANFPNGVAKALRDLFISGINEDLNN